VGTLLPQAKEYRYVSEHHLSVDETETHEHAPATRERRCCVVAKHSVVIGQPNRFVASR
jgi:hypothetical protein